MATIQYKKYQKAMAILDKYDAMLEELNGITAELVESEREMEMLEEIYGEMIEEQEKLNDTLFKWTNNVEE